MLETRRAKECQRGIAGAAERAKEGGRVPFESSDTRLGLRGRAFESPHSDQNSAKLFNFAEFFFIFTSIYPKINFLSYRNSMEGRSMVIETKRLILRPFFEGDAADVYEYLKEPAVNCFA